MATCFFLTLIVIGHAYHLGKWILLVRNIIVLGTQSRQQIVPFLTWTADLRDVLPHGSNIATSNTWCVLIHVDFWLFLMKAAAADKKLFKVRVDLNNFVDASLTCHECLSYLPWSACVFDVFVDVHMRSILQSRIRCWCFFTSPSASRWQSLSRLVWQISSWFRLY